MKVYLISCLVLSEAIATVARPNVIIMQPDDFLFYDYWNPPAHWSTTRDIASIDVESLLPNIEKLRTDGLEMTRAHAASPMCGTSRYATLTGRYPSRSHTTGKIDRDEVAKVTIPTTKLEGLDCTRDNLAVAFSAQGYLTGVVGKWHISHLPEPYTNDAMRALIQGCGFDMAEAIYPENLPDQDPTWTQPGLNHNTEHVVEEAINIMNVTQQENKPFFLYVNPTAPHSSGDVSDALESGNCLETPSGILETEPTAMVGGYENCAKYRESVLERGGDGASDTTLGAIWIDDAVGAIYRHLQNIGQLRNTIFLFQIDHGQEGKNTLFETGSRILQFVHYPAVITPSKFEGLVSNIDIAPTVMDYAGITESSTGYYETDGLSWRGVIDDPSNWSNRCIIAEAGTDRTVTCGCDKLFYFPFERTSTSMTQKAINSGLVQETSVLNLCDDDGNYITTPEETTESVAVDDEDILGRLAGVLICHLRMTKPHIIDDEFGVCDARNLAGGVGFSTGQIPDGGAGGGTGAVSCSENLQPGFDQPTLGACMSGERNDFFEYPTDFNNGIMHKSKHFECPTSGLRIILSNGIPDHDFMLRNPNPPCEANYLLKLPLFPEFSGDIVEPRALGFIAMSLNGVPAYGAQESGGLNAVEKQINSDFNSIPFYGHGTADGLWHYHSGGFGISDNLAAGDLIKSDTLLGYAADGFPLYGPVEDPDAELDECNGAGDSVENYRYHVRIFDDIDENEPYCNGNSPVVTWKYIVGCFKGTFNNSAIADSTVEVLPSDCVAVAEPTSNVDICSFAPRRGICRARRGADGRRCRWNNGSCKSRRPCEEFNRANPCEAQQCRWWRRRGICIPRGRFQQ